MLGSWTFMVKECVSECVCVCVCVWEGFGMGSYRSIDRSMDVTLWKAETIDCESCTCVFIVCGLENKE